MILTFLGPKWIAASPILVLLGIAALTEPILNSTNWLFITQARTRELLHAGLVSASLTIAAIVAGLPWHATGVAAGIALSSVLLRSPILIAWVCRRGPVRSGAFYQSLVPVPPRRSVFSRHCTSFADAFLRSRRSLACSPRVLSPLSSCRPPRAKRLLSARAFSSPAARPSPGGSSMRMTSCAFSRRSALPPACWRR